MISVVAGCFGVKLCAHAAQDFRLQQCESVNRTHNFIAMKNSTIPNSAQTGATTHCDVGMYFDPCCLVSLDGFAKVK